MFLPDNLQGIRQTCRRNDRRAMLVIMKDRNIQHLFEFFFNIEALRRLDILQVDTAKGRGDGCHDLDNFVRIMAVHFDVEHIHVGKFFEEHTLPLHNGLAGQRTPVTQALRPAMARLNGSILRI